MKKLLIKIGLVFLLIFFFFGERAKADSEEYVLSNEVLIYSFMTSSGKVLVLAKDKDDTYIVYRFGTESEIEFQYPVKTKASWKQFTYSGYIRGSGPANEGLELNYVYFVNDNYKYVIYDNYYAVTGEITTGVKIINLKTKEQSEIKGEPNSRIGSILDLRDNKMVIQGEEQFE